jgi:hypothetical protein
MLLISLLREGYAYGGVYVYTWGVLSTVHQRRKWQSNKSSKESKKRGRSWVDTPSIPSLSKRNIGVKADNVYYNAQLYAYIYIIRDIIINIMMYIYYIIIL